MQGTNPTYMSEGLYTYIFPCEEPIQHTCQKGSALTFDHVGKHPTVTSECLCTYIWSCGNTSHSHIRIALNSRLSIPGNWLGASILPENGIQRLYLIMWEHISQSPQNGLALTSDHGRNLSSHHDRMAQPLHLTMEGTNPLTMSEWLWVSTLSLGGNLDLENTKSLP